MHDSESGALKPSRRDFLKGAGLLLAGKALHFKMPENSQTQTEKTVQDLVKEVESLSEAELHKELFQNYAVVPDITPIKDRLNAITTIPEGSTLMKTGTSVAHGMFESIYGEGINQSEINLGDDQYKAEVVQKYLEIPNGALNAAVISGIDAPQLLYDSMFCVTSEALPCPPGKSVIDAYIDHYNPKIAINFIGSNMIRNNTSLEDFGKNAEELIQHEIDRGIIPILTTIPEAPTATEEPYKSWFENPKAVVDPGQSPEDAKKEEIKYRTVSRPENTMKYNVLLLKIAEQHQIPIINLQRGVVESALSNGTITAEETNWGEVDPEHFSYAHETSPLTVQNIDQKFQYGEVAVSYFTIETIYNILEGQK